MGQVVTQCRKDLLIQTPYFLTASRNLLLILARNPVLGKCKTRLAAKIGDHAALEVYKILLEHTVDITKDLPCAKQVYYSEQIIDIDVWDSGLFEKKLQHGADLGQRMQDAFQKGFKEGYTNIVLIGSDMYDLSKDDILQAFDKLQENDAVLGPALDGGYYLLGLKQLMPAVFENKNWGTASVFESTMKDLQGLKVGLLAEKNDIDRYEDILNIQAFKPFLIDLRP